MPREVRLVGDLTLGEAYQGDPDQGTQPWPRPFICVLEKARFKGKAIFKEENVFLRSNYGVIKIRDLLKNGFIQKALFKAPGFFDSKSRPARLGFI